MGRCTSSYPWYFQQTVSYDSALPIFCENGSFNIALGKAKKELVDFRLQKSLPASLQSKDLIPLLNKAWSKSFGRVKQNKKGISDHGWNPLNFNLILLPEIRATMTQKEIQAEKEETPTIILPNHFVPNVDTALSSASTGNNESTFTRTTCSCTTATDTQQSSLNLHRSCKIQNESSQEFFFKREKLIDWELMYLLLVKKI